MSNKNIPKIERPSFKPQEVQNFSEKNLEGISQAVELSVKDRLKLNQELFPTLEKIKAEKALYNQEKNSLIQKISSTGETQAQSTFNILNTDITIVVSLENGSFVDSAIINGQEQDFTQWLLTQK